MEPVALTLLVVVLAIVFGAACGVWSAFRLRRIDSDIRALRDELAEVRRGLRRAPSLPQDSGRALSTEKEPTPPPQAAEARPPEQPPPKPAPVFVDKPYTQREAVLSPSQPEALRPEPVKSIGGPEWLSSLPSFEQMLGIKALGWVGMFMVLVGMALFLKYAYDNNWIGPEGRLVIGVVAGCIALGFGERFRRNDWPVLFQTLSGGGIAIFYICIFFSFQVYHLSGATAAMGLAALVTIFSVAMAVFHEAVAIAILGLIGGFLSPVLLSTGVNHPYALFVYVAILDCVALGAAYFRRWRALDLLCFVGTAVLYYAWYDRFYKADQLTPALIFNSVFYVMFLLIPTLHGIVRRLPERYEDLALLAANAAYSLVWYYDLLFQHYRQALGFVVIGQAVLVFLLFHVYATRLGKDAYTAQSLLTISMALVAIAVPIQLKLYGIPIAWAMEAVVFAILGTRMGQVTGRLGGVAALILAAGGLVHRLPLHTAKFVPVFNIPFGSWLVVIAAAVIVGLVLRRGEKRAGEGVYLYGAAFLLAVVLASVLPSMEVWHFWRFVDVTHRATHQMSSLLVLWTLIPAIVTVVVARFGDVKLAPLAWCAWGVGGLMFIAGLDEYTWESQYLVCNVLFLPRVLYILGLWWMSRPWRITQPNNAATIFRVAGHALLVVLVAFELERWGHHSAWVSHRMSISLISGAWALQAFILVWMGLAGRDQTLRIVGFAVYALAVGKVLVVDTSQLQEVSRIVSWMATGLFSLGTGYFYHRYSAALLRERGGKPT